MTSTQIRIKKSPRNNKKAARRINPEGLGRLLMIALVFGLLTFSRGIYWWFGFGFLGLILVTLSMRSSRRLVPWMASIAELLLAFTHTGVMPFGWGMASLATAFTVYLVMLLAPHRETGRAAPDARSYRPPTWVGYPPLHKSAELYNPPNAAGKKR